MHSWNYFYIPSISHMSHTHTHTHTLTHTQTCSGGIEFIFNGTNLDVVERPILVVSDPNYVNATNVSHLQSRTCIALKINHLWAYYKPSTFCIIIIILFHTMSCKCSPPPSSPEYAMCRRELHGDKLCDSAPQSNARRRCWWNRLHHTSWRCPRAWPSGQCQSTDPRAAKPWQLQIGWYRVHVLHRNH
jgi:hypothetical protein